MHNACEYSPGKRGARSLYWVWLVLTFCCGRLRDWWTWCCRTVRRLTCRRIVCSRPTIPSQHNASQCVPIRHAALRSPTKSVVAEAEHAIGPRAGALRVACGSAMSAASRARHAQADWYSQFDEQFNDLLHLRGGQPQQQSAQQSKQLNSQPSHGAAAVTLLTPSSEPQRKSVDPVVRPAAAAPTPLARPQSSQASQRRRTQARSRRTNSDVHQQSQQRQPRVASSVPVTPAQARHDGVPLEFQQMLQQQGDGKQRATEYKQQRAREKAEAKATEEAKRAAHKAKMKAIQLRTPSSPAHPSSSPPTQMPIASRPTSTRSERQSQAAVTVESVPLRSAVVAPLPPSVAANLSPTRQFCRTRNTPPKQPSPPRTPAKQPPPPAPPAPSSSHPPPPPSPHTTPPSTATPAASERDSLRSLMRAARRQLRRRSDGGGEALVEVRVGAPYTVRRGGGGGGGGGGRSSGEGQGRGGRGGDSGRGSVDGMFGHRASCEFDVVFASGAASLASSPIVTRRGTVDSQAAVAESPITRI